MSQSNIFQKIKEEHPLLDYARNELGMQLRQVGSGFRGKSINPGNNDTCLCIYDDQNRWYDFKECVGGDVIDLCALVLHGGDRGAAIRELGGVEYGNWEQYSCNLDD